MSLIYSRYFISEFLAYLIERCANDGKKEGPLQWKSSQPHVKHQIDRTPCLQNEHWFQSRLIFIKIAMAEAATYLDIA